MDTDTQLPPICLDDDLLEIWAQSQMTNPDMMLTATFILATIGNKSGE
ncbi:MAG: hypothetical protein ACI4QL_01075 [Candidatus Fimimonas sp.]